MAQTTYKIPDGYSIQDDFPNHKVAPDRLTLEINGSAIITALSGISTSGDICAVIFKDALSDGDVTILDGIVATHSGEPLPQDARQASYQKPFTKEGANFIVSGKRFVANLNATTNCDTTFDEERELQGARICVENGTDGDNVDFMVYHPQAGIILQWAEHIYVKPGSGVRDEYVTGDSKALPAGLILRMVYHSVATTGSQPIIYLDFLGWR